jgi:mortality factor 4-like protein 1
MLTTQVNFGPFIAYTNIDTESLNILREYINDIMKWVYLSAISLTTPRWMIKEQKRLFVKEYETTTTQYQNMSRT